MESLTFKTNIKCSGCVAKATPFLNGAAGAANWDVDVQNPDKVLTVVADGADADSIVQAVQNAGYQAELLN